jgi:hypothetical protein
MALLCERNFLSRITMRYLQGFITTMLLISFSFHCRVSSAQADSVLLLNGKSFSGSIGETGNGIIPLTITNKKGQTKLMQLAEYRVFSYTKAGVEKVSYFQDDFQGNFLTTDQARAATYGSYDARIKFKPRLAFWSSALIGFSSTLFDTYLSQKAVADSNSLYTDPGFFKNEPSIFPFFVPPTLMVGWAIPKTKVRYNKMLHMQYHGNEDFFRGYHRVARQKRMLAALRGGAIGVAVGLLTYYVVS